MALHSSWMVAATEDAPEDDRPLTYAETQDAASGYEWLARDLTDVEREVFRVLYDGGWEGTWPELVAVARELAA